MKNIEDLNNQEAEAEPKREKKEGDFEEEQNEEDKKRLKKLKEFASEKFSAIANKLVKHEKALAGKESGDIDYSEKDILSDSEAESFLKTVAENMVGIKKILPDLLSPEILRRVYKALGFDILEGRLKSDTNDYLWFIDLISWGEAKDKKEFVKSVSDFIGSREASYKNYPPGVINSLEAAANPQPERD